MAMRRGHELRIPRLRRKLSPEEFDETLLWLKTQPKYRELIRQRISDAQKEVKRMDNVRESRQRHKRVDVDKLGREVDGCG